MPATPCLSIIVPTLDEARDIETQLASLQGSWVCGCEIVADGGSSDTTTALAAPYASRVIVSPPRRARQMNAGANRGGALA